MANKLINLNPDTGLTIGLFASSKQGKTELIKWLWTNLFRKDYITILCAPTCSAPTYDIFRDECVMTEHPKVLTSLIRAAHKIQARTRNAFKFLFILDDCTLERENTTLRDMFLTLRNMNISTILSLQACKLMNNHNRSSMNYGFFGRFLGREGIVPIVDNFLDGVFDKIGKKDAKIAAYREATNAYHFIFKDMLDGDRYCRFKIKIKP